MNDLRCLRCGARLLTDVKTGWLYCTRCGESYVDEGALLHGEKRFASLFGLVISFALAGLLWMVVVGLWRALR